MDPIIQNNLLRGFLLLQKNHLWLLFQIFSQVLFSSLEVKMLEIILIHWLIYVRTSSGGQGINTPSEC